VAVPRFTGVGIHDYPFNSSPARISPWAGLFLCITGLCQAHVSVVLQGAEEVAAVALAPSLCGPCRQGAGLQSPRAHTAATDLNPSDSAWLVFILTLPSAAKR
jgi:hypothetical protein